MGVGSLASCGGAASRGKKKKKKGPKWIQAKGSALNKVALVVL